VAQRIAKQTTQGVSIWDVHVPVKEGKVDFEGQFGGKLDRWLGYMLSEGNNTTPPRNLKWDESLRLLLEGFQKHFEDGVTILKNIESLHYLKFSLLKKRDAEGRDRTYFCFCTQFDDGSNGEQDYIDDMYQQYGALMEVVWHHCEGVSDLLEEPTELNEPPDPCVESRSQGFKLSEDFQKLVDDNNVDRDNELCFFNSNPYVTSKNIKYWQADKLKLSKVTVVVGEARIARQKPFADPAKILNDLILKLDQLKV
jgi:hypothetical protein